MDILDSDYKDNQNDEVIDKIIDAMLLIDTSTDEGFKYFDLLNQGLEKYLKSRYKMAVFKMYYIALNRIKKFR